MDLFHFDVVLYAVVVLSFVILLVTGVTDGRKMHVDLPSGESAELRTVLKAKDKFAVQAAIRLVTDGSFDGSIMSLVETALFARIIDSWTYDAELPGKHACETCTGNSMVWHEHVRDLIGETMDIDDYNKLEELASPLIQKVMQAPNLETSSGSAVSS